jgi:hypothetical protein
MRAVKLAIVLGKIKDFFFTIEIDLLGVIHLYFLESKAFFATDTVDIALFQLDQRYAVFYMLFLLMDDIILKIKLVLKVLNIVRKTFIHILQIVILIK